MQALSPIYASEGVLIFTTIVPIIFFNARIDCCDFFVGVLLHVPIVVFLLFLAFLSADVVTKLHWNYASLFSPLFTLLGGATILLFIGGCVALHDNISMYGRVQQEIDNRIAARKRERKKIGRYRSFSSSAW